MVLYDCSDSIFQTALMADKQQILFYPKLARGRWLMVTLIEIKKTLITFLIYLKRGKNLPPGCDILADVYTN